MRKRWKSLRFHSQKISSGPIRKRRNHAGDISSRDEITHKKFFVQGVPLFLSINNSTNPATKDVREQSMQIFHL
jgi:hypothetical protein